VLVQWRIEPTRHTGRVAGTVQVTLIFDLPPSPAPADEVHARSVAGIRQVHHRSAGTGPAESESVAGHRGPRHPDPVWPAALSEVTQRTTRCVGGAFPAEVQPDARRSGWEPRLPADPATMRGPHPGITGDLPGHGKPVTGPDGHRYRRSKRFGEPLAPARFRPPYVRNHCYAGTHDGTS
jgi:hypothetical protein